MAAVFATPVAAVLLAVELLLFEWKPRSFIPVAVAAMTAAVLRVPLLGAGPIFPVAPHAALGPGALGAAVLVGLLAGFGSGALTVLVYFFEDLFAKLPIHWMWWPAIGGVFVGLGGWFDPRVLGVGYELIHGLLRGEILGAALLGLLVGKALVWAMALGSGTSGGVLAPLLIMGGALGAVLGQWLPTGDAGLWAMVGMAAMMGGTMRSPLTGMFFLAGADPRFQCSARAALWLGGRARSHGAAAQTLDPDRKAGPPRPARRARIRGGSLRVDARGRRDGSPSRHVVADDLPLDEFAARVCRTRCRSLPSPRGVARQRGRALVGHHHPRRRGARAPGATGPSADGARRRRRALAGRARHLADETLHDAIARLLRHDIGRLPVVSRENPRQIVGYLGRADILAARHRYHHEEDVRERGFERNGARVV